MASNRRITQRRPVAVSAAAAYAAGRADLRVADIGGGTGWTLVQTLKLACSRRPGVRCTPTCSDIAPDAVAFGRERFPELDLRHRTFDPADGPFDIAMLIDVLQHLENPWRMLRDVHAAADYLVVRQPLLASLSTFRNAACRAHRERLGRIGIVDVRQFEDMAGACGWEPLRPDLAALRERPVNRGTRAPWWKKGLARWNRERMAHIFGGFDLNGAFKRR